LKEGLENWSYIKVVRDPVMRCISSYRHALKHGYEDSKISRVLGRPLDHRQGFSYREFIDYLERINLDRCNTHHRFQMHTLDRVDFRRTWLIDIEKCDLAKALAEIDRCQGFSSSEGLTLRDEAISAAARRRARGVDRAYSENVWNQPLAYRDTSTWPVSQLAGSEIAASRVRKLYARDYEMIRKLSEKSLPL